MKSDESESVGAPIEVLVPRPEPSMSMFANKQDYETARAGTGVQPPAGGVRWHLEPNIGYEGNEPSLSSLVYRYYHGALGCTIEEAGDWCLRYMRAYESAETQRSPQPSRPDEKEGGPAIEDRARLLDALETIDIIWRHYVKPHTSDWRETEKAIKTIRAALGVEPDAAIRERT